MTPRASGEAGEDVSHSASREGAKVAVGRGAAVARGWRVLRTLRRHGLLGALRGREHWPPPAALLGALEDLGVVYLKFGQVLALRRDLLPIEYIHALENLHDALPPVPFETVRDTVEDALGAPLESLYAFFDPKPLATATIAQVHTAKLTDGRGVVVKARRPGLDRLIGADTAVLHRLAVALERVNPRVRSLNLVGMVEEFRTSLLRETDLLLEAQTIRRFKEALSDVRGLWIPDVVPACTASAVLTIEHSPGIRIDRWAREHPEDARELAERLTILVLHQVFETGLFQADPHPGNVFVLPDGRLCLHDFGMTGELSRATVDALADALEAFLDRDPARLADAYVALGWVGADVDRSAFEQDLADLVRSIHERPREQLSIGEAFQSLLRIGSRHRIRNPGELLLLTRAFLITEALMHELAPDLTVVDVFRGELERITLRRYAPARLLERGRVALRDVERVTRDLPRRLDRVLGRVATGDLGRVQLPALEAAGERASRDLERLTGALASAALVVAGALLVGVGGWHRVAGDILLAAGLIGTVLTAGGAWWQRRG